MPYQNLTYHYRHFKLKISNYVYTCACSAFFLISLICYVTLKDDSDTENVTDVLEGINPNTVHRQRKSFDYFQPQTSFQKSLDFVQFEKNNKIIKKDHYAPFDVVIDPLKELEYCISGQHDCQAWPESRGKWPSLDLKTYKKVISRPKRHTSNRASLVEQIYPDPVKSHKCHLNDVITLKVQAKNFKKENKTYGGDFILARMVPKKYPKFSWQQTEIADPQDVTIILGKVKDNLDGTYKIKLPCRIIGDYRIEVILMRNSETMSALTRMFNTVQSKGKYSTGLLSYGNETELSNQCGSIIPEMLYDSHYPNWKKDWEDIQFPKYSRVCPISTVPGREWYCRKPDNRKWEECGELIWMGN